MIERVVLHSKWLLLVAVGWMIVDLPVVGQSTDEAAKAPTFAVATIKPGRHVNGFGEIPYNGGYSAREATIKDLISVAYNLPWGTDGLISGGPKWAYTDTFDIEAKAESDIEGKAINHPTSDQIVNLDMLMLQRLLESRFKLRVHHETRQVEGFALTVAHGGSKLNHSEVLPGPNADNTQTYAFGAHLPKRKIRSRLMPGDLHAPQATMGWLAGYLQFQPETEGHIVIDKTGIVGDFDISLRWLPEGVEGSNSPKEGSELPSLFTALEEQLGLKLERTKVTADTIVIDHVERPSEN